MLAAALFLAPAAVLAQKATPSPPADDDVVKISTNLIQIDVTVTDGKGKIVTDLKPEEIEIYENGEKQKVTNFSFVRGTREAANVESDKKQVDKTAIPVPQAALRTDAVRRTFALVVDDLSLSFESAYFTRRALKKFVDEQMRDGDLVAIVRTGAGVGALQQFTTDKRILYAAIERVKWNPRGTGGISAFAPVQPSPLESLQAAGDTTITDEDIEAETNRNNANEDFRNGVFVTGTLGALQYIVTGMGELPGRKSVILFSDGFRLLERDENGNESTGPVFDFLKKLVDLANRSSVVFYTVDSRGLQTTALTAEDAPLNMRATLAALSARSEQLIETQAGLSYLARETGGIDFKNTNDLSGAVRRVLEDQSYYLVGYDPGSDTFDPVKRKFNKLTVKILRKGAQVRYRSGFFNVADRERPTNTVAGVTPVGQLRNALVSPFAVTGIPVRLNALFGSDAKEGSFVRSLLHIDASVLKFTDGKEGFKKAVFDVLAVSFGDNGRPIDQIGKTYTLEAKGETLRRIMTEGFVYHFTFPVKKPGPYQYRVAIRDTQGGKLGSASQFIEVPNLKKGVLTLSSIVLENLTAEEFARSTSQNAGAVRTDPMADTALRVVKQGSVLRYGLEVYNAKLDSAKQQKLTTRIRVFRDGKIVLDGATKNFDLFGQTDMQHLKFAGAISIGKQMQPGDYILQIIVTDPLAKEKKQIATQYVEFEVVE